MTIAVNTMKAALQTELEAASPMATPAELADAIAKALVPYLKANVVVLPTAMVWPGGMAPAPVTGTGTIT